jgi:mono/diheme cytochrome c family protein
MPGGKGDYTEWQTNHTPEVSDRRLNQLARLLEMAPSAHRERLLAGVKAGLEQGPAVEQVPPRLLAIVAAWWAARPHTGTFLDVAARLGYPEAVKALAADAAGGPERSGTSRPAERSAVDAGRNAFDSLCATCHQTDGGGMARLAPPLRNSTWVLGHEDLLARIVLNGLQGELLMPPMATLDDRQLAAILTYVRQAWGHGAGPVSAETVRRVRTDVEARRAPWTAAELSALAVRE